MSNAVIGPIPLRPASSAAQKSSVVEPSGVTTPRPVTTTRRSTTDRFVVAVLEGMAGTTSGRDNINPFRGSSADLMPLDEL